MIAHHRRSPSPTIILAVVAFGVFVAADDLTVVSTMLRQIIFDLEIPLPDDLNRAAWIVNAYLIAYVVVMPFVGRLSDIVGRRAVFLGAFVLFLAGSVWIPMTKTLSWFLVGRVLTAVGGGAMVPVAMAVIGDVYSPQQRATALGVLGAIDTAGWVWGPLYGALLVRYLNWRWQFYLNIPLSLIGMGLVWWALADLPRPSRRERIDWAGTAVLSICLIALNVALLNSGDIQTAGSFTDLSSNHTPQTAFWYIVAAITFILFLFVERQITRQHTSQSDTPPPLIDLTLFQRRNFRPAILVNFLVGAVLIVAMVNVPLVVNVLQVTLEKAALFSGYLLSGMTGSMAIMALAGGHLTSRLGYRPVVLAGLVLCGSGLASMGYTWQVETPLAQMAWQLVVLGSGFGLVIAPIGTAVINAAPPNQRGIAASLVIVLRLIGMSVGLSALTAWGLRRFQILRTQITLPDLPLNDPIYQQAIIEGLTRVTVQVLAETFLVSAFIMLLALLVGLRLQNED